MAVYEQPVRRRAARRGAALGRRDAASRARSWCPAELTAAAVTHEGVLTAMEPGGDVPRLRDHRRAPTRRDALRAGRARAVGRAGAQARRRRRRHRERQDARTATSGIDAARGAISDEPLGAPAYVSLAKARELLGHVGRRATTRMYVNVDRGARRGDQGRPVRPARRRERQRQGRACSRSLLEMMEFAYFYEGLLYAFGWAMAFVVIYTTFTSNVLERTREIATMRTIGESNARLAVMVTIENLLLAVAGIPLGHLARAKRRPRRSTPRSPSEAYSLKATIIARERRVAVVPPRWSCCCSPRSRRSAASSGWTSPRRPRSWSR